MFIILPERPYINGNMEIWKYGNMEIWKYGNMEIWKYGNMEIWQYGNMEIMIICLFNYYFSNVCSVSCTEVFVIREFGS